MDVKLGAGYLSSALLLLKSFRTSASHLERISLQFNCQTFFIGNPDFNLADFLVQFIFKMKHLTALCLVFYELYPSLIRQVNQKIADKILPDLAASSRSVVLSRQKDSKRSRTKCFSCLLP